jgi:hypothetical protein
LPRRYYLRCCGANQTEMQLSSAFAETLEGSAPYETAAREFSPTEERTHWPARSCRGIWTPSPWRPLLHWFPAIGRMRARQLSAINVENTAARSFLYVLGNSEK